MEEVLGFLGFSLDASIGISLARGLGSGMRPALVQLFKAGLAARDVARGAATRVGSTVSSATAEARENLNDVRAEAVAERDAGRARPRPQRRPAQNRDRSLVSGAA